MSRIDTLIEQLCPKGVPFLPIGEVAQIASARVVIGSLDRSTYVGVDNLLPNFGGRRDSEYLAGSSNAIGFQPGDVLIGNIRPYLKKVWLADRAGGASPDVLTLSLRPSTRESMVPSFLYYVIASDSFVRYSMQHAKGGKMPRGDKVATLSYKIPVPPMAVQREIVRVLDAFQRLDAELGAELGLRRRQYAYYRDSLLTFSETARNVRWVPIGEFAELVRGNGMPKSDFVDVGVPAIHYGEIYTHYGTWAAQARSFVAPATATRLATVSPGDIVITNTSENIEDVGKAVAWLGGERAVTGGHATVIRHAQSPKFLAYYFQTAEFGAAKRKHATGTKVIDVSAKSLAKIVVPLPPTEEQERIVAILDKFDALVNDLSVGLPAELAARRQQHAYYGNRLLTFEEAAA